MKRCPRCKQSFPGELQHCPDDGTPLVDRLPGNDRFMGRILAGRYEVLELLGRGGFGTVFKVRDRKMEDVIALKVFERGRFSDREAQEAMGRFRREGVILRRTGKRSRHIVTVYDFEEDEAEDLFYFTMDFVDGITLSQVLATEGPLSVHRTLYLARQICAALEAAHQEGVVHRDLKLENLMVVQEGGEEVVKVLDFGIAKVMGSGSLTNLAMGVPGTPGYASPEQLQAPSTVDPRTDLFALGVVLYGLLSGREPWSSTCIAGPTSSDGVWELIRGSMEKDPFPLRKWNPDVPRRLEAAIVRLLSKRQEDRFQSAAELDRELAAIQEHVHAEGTGASAKGGAGGAGRPARRTLLLVGTAAILIPVAFFTLPRSTGFPGLPPGERGEGEVAAGDAAGPGPDAPIPGPGEEVDVGGAGVERAQSAPETSARAAARTETPPLRISDLTIGSYLFSDGHFTLEGSFRVAGPPGAELCVASLFAQADQGPLRDRDGEFTLGGVVAAIDPPLSSPPEPGELTFSHRLPAAQLDLGRGTLQIAASTRIWAGPCSSVDPASPPLAQASTEPLCVTRLAGGWYPCRGGS